MNSELRQRAEAIAREKEPLSPQALDALSPEEVRALLHEYGVHQIELELQNEELRQAQDALASARLRYFDLYNLAPIGYCTLNEQGVILDANLAFGSLLGLPRSAVVKKPISSFIYEQDQDIYYLVQKRLLMKEEAQAFELRLRKTPDEYRWVHLDATGSKSEAGETIFRVVISDISENKFREEEKALIASLATRVTLPGDFRESLADLTGVLQGWSGCEAVGIRLAAGEDYPYFETRGFPPSFVLAESHLCAQGPDGKLLRDENGKPVVECMCGNILCGRTDLAKPFFTAHGSFWTNSTTALLAGTTEPDRQGHTRNRCNREGYESVALIPLRMGQVTFGLLQFNDRRKNRFTPGRIAGFERLADSIALILSRRGVLEELQASETRHRTLLENISVGVTVHDADATLTYANPAASAIIGLTKDQMQGIIALKSPCNFIQEDGTPLASADFPVSRVIAAGAPVKNQILGIKSPSCINVRWLLVSAYPILDGDSHVSEVFVTFIDITDRKKAQAELATLEKLKSVGTLAGGIAHDFNNIMMGLFGNIALAKNEIPKNHPSYAPLETAELAMGRAVNLTKQLLTFSKGGNPVKQPIRLSVLVETVARFDLSGSNVMLVYRSAPDLWMAMADGGQIQQVISNLTTNARQAMPDGGSLYISLENEDLAADVVGALPAGKYIRITVRDEGGGIEPRYIDEIFDPYFTTKQSGSGLGLATVYSVIKKHGGHITVTSELGKGATFTLYLPASDPQVQPVPVSAARSAAFKLPVKVLVLDDEEYIREVVASWLKEEGCSVKTSDKGRRTIELYRQAKKAGVPFDVMILDVTVPGGPGGQDVLREIRAFDPDARAIVISGYSEGELMTKPEFFGFRAALAKPFTKAELLDVLGRVLS